MHIVIERILEDWFSDTNIKDKDKINYLILCDYYNEEKTYKNKHFKKLKKRIKKEIDRI